MTMSLSLWARWLWAVTSGHAQSWPWWNWSSATDRAALTAVALDDPNTAQVCFPERGPRCADADLGLCLAAALQHNTRLTELLLLRPLAGQDACFLALALSRTRSLRALTLRPLFACALGTDEAACLADGLRCNTSLRSLRLAHWRISGDVARLLGEALAVHGSMHELAMDHCAFERGAAGHFAAALRGPGSRIAELSLRWCAVGPEDVRQLVRSAAASPALEALDLHGATVDARAAGAVGSALIDALLANERLVRLDVAGLGLLPVHVDALSRVVASNARRAARQTLRDQ